LVFISSLFRRSAFCMEFLWREGQVSLVQRDFGDIMSDLLFLLVGLGSFVLLSLYARWAAGA